MSEIVRVKGTADRMGPSPANMDRAAADVTVANTTTETALGSYTIGAFELDGDHAFNMKGHGRHRNGSGVFVTTTYRVRLNGTVLWESSFGTSDSGANEAPFEYDLTIQAVESDAVQALHGFLILGALGVMPAVGRGDLTTVVGAGILAGDGSEDATSALLFEFTVEMDTAHANAYFVNEFTTVDYY